MKRFIFLAVAICLLQTPQVQGALVDSPFGEGTGGNTVIGNYPSPLTITENITDLGDGSYLYEYDFVNVDTSPIWLFSVCTNFENTVNSGFTEHSSWYMIYALANEVYSEYDARNLDPAIVGFAAGYTELLMDTDDAMQVGEAASGYSFIASVYDTSQKWYFYETIASGYTQTNGTGNVAAVGLTVPEPATMALLAFGSLLLRKRRA